MQACDINCDDDIDIKDVTILINVITKKNTDPILIERSDIDGDNKPTVLDITKLIYCYIFQECNEQRRQAILFPKFRSNKTYGLNNTCTLPAFTTNAYTGTFGLNLENDDSVKSGQIRFTYDSTIGLDITDVNFTNRVKNYSKSFTKEDSDPENVEILVLFYSMKRDATILPGTGNILEFDYTTTDTTCGTTALTFKELILGDSNANALSSNAQNGSLIIAPPSEDITFDLNHVITILQYLSGIEAHDTILELDTNHNNRIGLEDLITILYQLSGKNR